MQHPSRNPAATEDKEEYPHPPKACRWQALLCLVCFVALDSFSSRCLTSVRTMPSLEDVR